MNIYVYNIKWYYDDNPIHSAGVVAAPSMKEAVNKLDGDLFENIEEIQLFILETSDYGSISFSDLNELITRKNLVDEG